jgi:hypothetical protein
VLASAVSSSIGRAAFDESCLFQVAKKEASVIVSVVAAAVAVLVALAIADAADKGLARAEIRRSKVVNLCDNGCVDVHHHSIGAPVTNKPKARILLLLPHVEQHLHLFGHCRAVDDDDATTILQSLSLIRQQESAVGLALVVVVVVVVLIVIWR